MTPILPEVKDELLAAAARRGARRRSWRRRATALVGGACALTGATAVAAGIGLVELGSGTTKRGSTYKIVAVRSADDVCLALSIDSPSGDLGRPPECVQPPVRQPITHGGVVHINGERLVAGVVREDVATVTVDPADGKVDLYPIEGSGLRYFHLLVDDRSELVITTYDAHGRSLSRVAMDDRGVVAARGDPAR